MKKVLLGLMVIFMIGMSVKTVDAQCWLTPPVTWEDNCTVGYVNFHYKITYTIYDMCAQPGGLLVFDHTNYELAGSLATEFCIPTAICTERPEPCNRVVVSIEKIDGQPSNPGALICRNYKIVEVTCEELQTLSVHIVLN